MAGGRARASGWCGIKNSVGRTCRLPAATGEEVYRDRIPHQGAGFSASPVAADGKIYLPSEDGDIFVVQAGPQFKLLGRNPMGEALMATPALAGGMMIVRGERHLFAVGR